MLKEAIFIGHFEAQGKLGDVFATQNNHMVPFETTTTKTNSYKLKTDSKC